MKVFYRGNGNSTKHSIKRTFRAAVLIKLFEGVISEQNNWTIEGKNLILTTVDDYEITVININELYDKLCRSGKHKKILTEIETGIYQKYIKKYEV